MEVAAAAAYPGRVPSDHSPLLPQRALLQDIGAQDLADEHTVLELFQRAAKLFPHIPGALQKTNVFLLIQLLCTSF